jgi:hypothetical protein
MPTLKDLGERNGGLANLGRFADLPSSSNIEDRRAEARYSNPAEWFQQEFWSLPMTFIPGASTLDRLGRGYAALQQPPFYLPPSDASPYAADIDRSALLANIRVRMPQPNPTILRIR